MTKPVSLEALLRRMSRMAEQHFNRVGDLDPVWLVETASGEQRTFVSPVVAPNSLAAAEFKDVLAEEAREMFRDLYVVRYAWAAECWAGGGFRPTMSPETIGLRYASLGYTLANAPDRREIISIQADDGTQLLMASRAIIRPSQGRAYLGKLGKVFRPDRIEGRFLGLLPSAAHAQAAKEVSPASDALARIRRSRELPEDVGRVFVTNVPGAPIQVIGRRDPATGELCVGSIIWDNKEDVPLGGIADDFGSEVVTGPEAERLILAVHQALTREANEQNLTLEEYLAAKQDAAERAWPDKVQHVREETARRRNQGDHEGADFLEKWIADQEQAR